MGLIPGPGRSPGGRHGNRLQYSCLENPEDREAWQDTVHWVGESQTQLKRLSMHARIGEGNGNPLQYSCLENPTDRGAWWAAVYGVAQNRTRLKQLSSSSSIHANNYSCVTVICPHVYLEKTQIQKDKSSPMFTAALFTTAKTWKQPKGPTKDEWIKMWYICTMEYCSVTSVVSVSL